MNRGVDFFGRCVSCGKRIESSAGCDCFYKTHQIVGNDHFAGDPSEAPRGQCVSCKRFASDDQEVVIKMI